MLVYQSAIISMVCLRLLFNCLFVTTQVIQNTGRRKHEEPVNMTRTLLFQHIPIFLPLHLQQPTYLFSGGLGKRSPAFSMSPANVNSEARREQKRAPREEPGTKDWIVTIKVVRRVNRNNTSSRLETKSRACSGTLQQRYCLKLGVVCIPGLEGRGMMVIMLLNKTTFFSGFFQTSQTSLYLFLFVTCKLIVLCECKQRSLRKLPQRHIYWSLSNFKRGRTTCAFNQYLEPENWSNTVT